MPWLLSKPIHTHLFHTVASDAELPEQEKAFIQFHVTMPEGPSLRILLQDPEERRKLGKCINGDKAQKDKVLVVKPRCTGNKLHHKPTCTGMVSMKACDELSGWVSPCQDTFFQGLSLKNASPGKAGKHHSSLLGC